VATAARRNQGALDRLNARNQAQGGKYRYSLKIEDYANAVLLYARQTQKSSFSVGDHTTSKEIGRRKSDGSLMKITFKRTKAGLMWTGNPAPKKWEAAMAKGGVTRLMNVVGLDGFIEIGEVYYAGHSTIGADGIHHYDADGKPLPAKE
jgi:hypothetical protein